MKWHLKSENNFQISTKRNLSPQCTTSPPKTNADQGRQAGYNMDNLLIQYESIVLDYSRSRKEK